MYAGLQESWGSAFKIGAAPVAGFLSINQVPGIGFMYNSSALPSDLRFDELNPAAYRLFNVRSLLAPAMPGTPGFLKPVADFGRFRVLDAPGGGYFDVVDVAAAVPITRYNFYDVTDRWLHSAWVERKQHLWIEFKGPDPKASAPTGLPRISADSPLPETQAPAASPGTVASERQNGQVYEAEFEAARPSFVLFKMTWHANWKAYVDGKAQNTAMLSPGFLGVPVAPGRHRILCRYEPGNWKIPMGAAGFVVVGLLIAVESSRRRPPAVDSQHRAGDKGRLRRTKV